jgi:cell division septal protein FtsQ
VKRRLVGAVLAAAAIGAGAYLLLFGDDTVEPERRPAVATSAIGSGDDAIGVSATGKLLVALPPPADGTVPSLPLAEPPESGRLSGPVLEQALVLGAAPAALRPCIAGSGSGERGLEVELSSGIELLFGNATQAAEKWRSAVALLADPSITTLSYVDLLDPSRPSVGGEGHTLPPAEDDSAGGCGK